MLACDPNSVNEAADDRLTGLRIFSAAFIRIESRRENSQREAQTVADVQIEDGIIKIASLDVQDPKAAAVLAEYPQVRWAEITRRALKIGLGYLKGGGKD